ncbi:MAG: hypothetical protein LKJ83_10660 [Eubacteriaceae bacterium]|jgi:hypothetical protein|nr:hypothetical protein [Eubacteriaceae bacterium]
MYNSGEFLINKKRIITDVMVIFCASALYILNAAVLKPFTSGFFNYFAVCYLNDFIAPCVILAYIDIIGGMGGIHIRGFAASEAMALTAGMFWETAAPLIRPDAVSDPLDVAAYAAGGVVYWFVCGRRA